MKITKLLILSTFVFSLAACGQEETVKEESEAVVVEESSEVEEEAVEEEPETEEEPEAGKSFGRKAGRPGGRVPSLSGYGILPL